MLYQNYLLKRISTAFIGIITILVLLIWFSRAVPFVRYITENGVEISQFLLLFLLILPWLLLIIIPISLFVALILSYNRLNTTNEITILKNSGLTKLQIAKPAIKLSIFLCIICALISFYIMPFANKKLRISKLNIKDNYASLAFNPQTFETLKNLTIYAKSRDELNQLSGILLHDKRSKKYSLTITAKSGKIVVENSSALLYMEEGTIQKFSEETGKSEIIYFDNYIFNLTENQKSTSELRWKAQERYLSELLNPEEDTTEAELKKYDSEIHERFTYPLFSVIFSLIAMSTMLHGQFSRRGNISNIILAIVMASIFMIVSITSYGLIESSSKFTFLPYLNCAIFLIISTKMLSANYRKIS
jgi:lipopolysaccharide export system permease protein